MQLYINDLAKPFAQDEAEILEMWQDIDLNSLQTLKPYMLELTSNLETALSEKATELGISTSSLITKILERQVSVT